MGPLTNQLGFSVEVNVMILVAANGLVNLISPTCGAIMGGLALARVDYPTWVKWAWKVVLYIGLAALTILTLAMLIFYKRPLKEKIKDFILFHICMVIMFIFFGYWKYTLPIGILIGIVLFIDEIYKDYKIKKQKKEYLEWLKETGRRR